MNTDGIQDFQEACQLSPEKPPEEEKEATKIVFNFGQKKDYHKSVTQLISHSPGEDDFEEQNLTQENIVEGHQLKKQTSQIIGNEIREGLAQLREQHIYDLTSNEQSPMSRSEIDSKILKIHEELALHKDAYEKVYKYYPPNPILPKQYCMQEGSPRKLTKFRGKDDGKSKFEIDKNVNRIEFSDNTTLKSIFQPSDPESRQTNFGEIVYIRSILDFSQKNNQPGTKKDEVLEENLIDVRRILKNSTQNKNKEDFYANKDGSPKKGGLINLQGVDQFYKKKDMFDKTLIFESRFESGNLASALKVNDNDYHLLLQNDVNTSGHTQWFFFRVQNTKQYNEVRFNMLNLSKPDSLFNEGMKVLVYSEKQSEDKDIGWHRACTKISYYQNGIRKESQKRFKSYYSLTFTYEFLYDDDTVYFAYCYPYTYTDLQEDLNRITSDPIKSQFCTRKTLCMSVAENKVEMLTITSKQNLETLSKRKGIFLTARVHPGESVGSWMMKGAIDFLTDETSEEAEILRQNYVFKIIPMLNPDGVINGNYRCSLAGCDLNRRWKAPSKVLHPCIYQTKQLMINFAKERELQLFCDFHGHSRRKNIFMYGCHVPGAPEETRFFPFLLSKICPYFVYNYSRFGNQKSKEATARVAMFNELKVPAIYTMESSFCGNDQGPYANYHFSTLNLMQTGKDFARTLLIYKNLSIPQNIANNLLTDILLLYNHYREANIVAQVTNSGDIYSRQNQLQEVETMRTFIEKMQFYKDSKTEITSKHLKKALFSVLQQTQDSIMDGDTTSSAGSDQAPSEDNLEPEEIQQLVPVILEEELSPKKSPKKKKDLNAQQEQATSISPARRKTTVIQDLNAFKRNSTIVKPNKRMSMLRNQQSKITNNSGSKVQLMSDSRKNTMDDNKIDEETITTEEKKSSSLKDQSEQYQETDDTVTHRKKRKRNVESRDAWTQTDRSDYMLIKYRQKQKQAIQMAKSQKFSKEEQMFYEQALGSNKNHHQFQMNKTQEIMSTQSSVNMALQKIMKNSSGAASLIVNSSSPQKPLQSPENPMSNYIDTSSSQQASHQMKLATNFSNQSKSYLKKGDQGNHFRNDKHENFSRNIQSQQSSSKNRIQNQVGVISGIGNQTNPQNLDYQNNNNNIFNNNPSSLIKAQPYEMTGIKQGIIDQQYQQHAQQYPYQQLSNTQEIKHLEKIDYQSNKLNTITATSQKGQMKNGSLLVQTVLPSIQTPNQIIKRKFNQIGSGNVIIKKGPEQNQVAPVFYQYNNSRVQENHSDLSSNHSTQRITNNLSFNLKNHEQFMHHHHSFVDQQQAYGQNTNLGTRQSLPKSLPPKPLQAQQVIQNITNSNEILNQNEQQKHQEMLMSKAANFNNQHQQVSNLRVLENTYIQQKLIQHEMQNPNKNIVGIAAAHDEEMKTFSNEYDTIKLDSAQQKRTTAAVSVVAGLDIQPKPALKGNFFQNTAIQDSPNTNANNNPQYQLNQKQKNKNEFYGSSQYNNNNINNFQPGMQGQSIKKMIENQWKANQQQQMSNSYYQGHHLHSNTHQQIFGNSDSSFVNGQQFILQNKPNRQKKQSQQRQKYQMQNSFITVQGMIPQNLQQQQNMQQNNNDGKVKISIVNVHNEMGGGNQVRQIEENKGIIYYNIHNNIIINNPSTSQKTSAGSKQSNGSKINNPRRK